MKANKEKGPGKLKIRSVKRIIITVSFLIIIGVVLFVAYNAVLTGKSVDADIEPCETGLQRADDVKPDGEKGDQELSALQTMVPSNEESNKTSSVLSDNKDISVQVINYTGVSGLAEKVRELLEARGFVVSAGNDSSLKYVNSVIIEKKDSVLSEDIKTILPVKKVRKDLDADSRFDVVIVLGDDYNHPK